MGFLFLFLNHFHIVTEVRMNQLWFFGKSHLVVQNWAGKEIVAEVWEESEVVSGRKWACLRISRPSHYSVPFRQNGSVPQGEATGGAGRREPRVLAIRAQRGCCDLSPQGGRAARWRLRWRLEGQVQGGWDQVGMGFERLIKRVLWVLWGKKKNKKPKMSLFSPSSLLVFVRFTGNGICVKLLHPTSWEGGWGGVGLDSRHCQDLFL